MTNITKYFLLPKPANQAEQDIFDSQLAAFELKIAKFTKVLDENGNPLKGKKHSTPEHHSDSEIGTTIYAINGCYNEAIAKLISEGGDPDFYKPLANIDIATDNIMHSVEDVEALGFKPEGLKD